MDFTEIFEKQSGERIPKGLDYTDRLPTGQVVATATVTVVEYPGGADLTASMIEGVPTVIPTRITALLKAGVNGTDYKVTYVATLDGGAILEDDLLMQVRDI